MLNSGAINIAISVLTVVDVIIAFLLIMLVLVQQSKDSGFGSAFGGMGESVFGAQTATHLTKLTVFFAGAFMVVTLALAVITSRRGVSKSLADKIPVSATAAPTKADSTAPATAEVPLTGISAPAAGKNDGTVVKTVPGGTITMTPVAKPADASATVAPAGTVTVTPAPAPSDKKPEESK